MIKNYRQNGGKITTTSTDECCCIAWKWVFIFVFATTAAFSAFAGVFPCTVSAKLLTEHDSTGCFTLMQTYSKNKQAIVGFVSRSECWNGCYSIKLIYKRQCIYTYLIRNLFTHSHRIQLHAHTEHWVYVTLFLPIKIENIQRNQCTEMRHGKSIKRETSL